MTREIAEEVLKSKGSARLGGTRQPVSILFSDIRSFTAISEQYPAERIVEFLNDYFKLMVHEIFAEQGTLDKFMGDGIMAVFGAPISRPDDPVRAVRAALGMRRGLRRFNAQQRERGAVEIEIGIGISHGESISGNIGSEQRMEYTVIGDSVNLASRLEGLTKNYPYKILIQRSDLRAGQGHVRLRPARRGVRQGQGPRRPGVRRGRPRLEAALPPARQRAREHRQRQHPQKVQGLRRPRPRAPGQRAPRGLRLGSTLVDHPRARRHDPRLAGEHLFAALVDAHGLKTDAIALGEHLDDLGPGGDDVAGLHRLDELQRLREVDRARTGQLGADDRRDQTRREDARRDRAP